MALLFLSKADAGQTWRDELLRRMPALEVRIWPEAGDPAAIEAALVWIPPRGELHRFPNLRVVLSLAAGVDRLLADPTLPDVPLVKMVDPSLTNGMCHYVLAAVLRHHRELDRHARTQARREWAFAFPPQARDRRIGIMGLGEMGKAAATALAGLGFPVAGWSRTVKQIDGIESFAGEDAFDSFLARSDILVCMLPLTAQTRGILNALTFAGLPKGAFVINVGRGEHLEEEDALIQALDVGQLAGATLDVFRDEPLPASSRLWAHPKVLVTPHIASWSDPRTAVDGVVENLRRLERGEPLLHLVDRKRGY